MGKGYALAVSLLACGLAAGTGQAAACDAALLESLATPRLVTTGDSYEVTLRRRLASTERADALLLKDALRKALSRDPSQSMQLRGVTYTAAVPCEGYRIVGLAVRKEHVSFVAAPTAPTVSSGEEPIERLVELWQSRQATTAQLRVLQLRMTQHGERTLAGQLVDDIAASMRQRELAPVQLPMLQGRTLD